MSLLVLEFASPEPQYSSNGLFWGNVFSRPRVSVFQPRRVPMTIYSTPPCWMFLVLPEVCFISLWPLPSQEKRTTDQNSTLALCPRHISVTYTWPARTPNHQNCTQSIYRLMSEVTCLSWVLVWVFFDFQADTQSSAHSPPRGNGCPSSLRLLQLGSMVHHLRRGVYLPSGDRQYPGCTPKFVRNKMSHPSQGFC